jgi:SAM-dependent methyltransferase
MAGMTDRALSFGSGAADYERHRPGYPAALVAEVLAYAGRPVRTALEIGAGTGKATRAFAAAGVDVLATDPDAGMLAELRRQVPGARTLRAGFEDLDGAGTYDLVFAAAAMHWTDPVGRWAKVASLLEPAGTFASFGGPIELADADLAEAVRHARAPFLADDGVASPDGTPAEAAMQWPGSELVAAPELADVRQVVLERRLVMPSADYLGHLSTISAYRVLPDAARRGALAAVWDVLPDEVHIVADVIGPLARRDPDGAVARIVELPRRLPARALHDRRSASCAGRICERPPHTRTVVRNMEWSSTM